jgi:hypothetical protein
MAGRNGQEMVGTYVPAELAARFKAWARSTEGGASAALRRLISGAVEGSEPDPPPGASGHQVLVRLKDAERLALLRAAKARSTTPANWLRSLAIVHLGRRPQWDAGEAQALREIGEELRRIGNNVNQIARALNVAALEGECPPFQGEVAMEAVQDVRAEMRRLVAVYTGNFDYWGLPDADRPTAAPGALKGEEQIEGEARSKRRLRPRRRPQAFTSAKAGEVAP